MKSRLVVSAIVKKGDKYLLGKKPNNIYPYPNTWHLLGGGVNLDEEKLEKAIRREVKEEASIELGTLKRVSFDEDYEPNKHGEMTHCLFLVFEGEYMSGELKANDDIETLRWFSKSDLKNIPLARPSIKLFKELKLI